MVQTAEADVVSPAVAAEDPHGLLRQELLVRQDFGNQLAGIALAQRLTLGLQFLTEAWISALGLASSSSTVQIPFSRAAM